MKIFFILFCALFCVSISTATDTTPPTVSSTDPYHHETNVAFNKNFSATFSEEMNAATINTTTFTVRQGQDPITGTVSYSGLTATFRATNPRLPKTTYYLTLTSGVEDLAGNAMASNYTWNFTTGEGSDSDATAPTVSSTDPSNNATNVDLNKCVSITFGEGMDAATINTTTFYLKQGTTNVPGTVSYSGYTATFCPSSALSPNMTYTFTITTGVKDLAGNAMANPYTGSFTTGAGADGTRPTVSSTEPSNGATNVDLNKCISTTFSEAMRATTINTTTFYLKQGTTNVPGTVSYYGSTATFCPSSNLTLNTTYTFTITTGVEDLAGNALANPYTSSFTTGSGSGSGADVTAPTTSSTDPSNNATNVDLNKCFSITFSEAMRATTINTTTLILKQGTTTVSGTVSYYGSTATFCPSSALSPNTTYTFTITTGVQDLAGNAMASPYTSSFTTGAAADVTAPTTSSTDPSNNATNVDLNRCVSATFSEAMRSTTINTTTFTMKQGNNTVSGTVSYYGSTATFCPTSNLSPNTTYTFTITTGAQDLAGNAMASPYTWSFTTGAAADVTAPTTSSTDPSNNATNVALNRCISATFSEAMRATTINTSTFTLSQAAGNVSGTVSYSGTTATFCPSSNLSPTTLYTAMITSGVQDLAGNAMASNYVWNFTTTTSSGVDDNASPSALNIALFPNPAHGEVTINVKEYNGNSLVAVVYSTDGKEISRQALTGSTTRIDLSKLSTAQYIVSVLDGDTIVYSERIIKQ